MRCSSRIAKISWQMSSSSFSTFTRYVAMDAPFASPRCERSLSSMEDKMRQDARRAPITFLYPTDNKLRSSICR